MRVLMLATDAHGGFGGIAQFNRDAIDALAGFPEVEEIVVLPRAIAEPDFAAPPKARYDRAAAGGRAAFIARALLQAAFGGPFGMVLCAHINLSPIAAACARIAHARLVLTVHGVDVWDPPPGRAAARAARAADLVVAVSQITADRMGRWLAGPPTAVVPNTIRPERFGMGPKDAALAARFGLEGRAVIMTMGRMAASERYKGFDEIIALMPRLLKARPDLVYLCVGDGDDRARLEAKARELGVAGAVVFTGRAPDEAKADYFRLADAYVMASTGEGFGIVVIEALACGLPVVGSTADGVREALLGGELGLLADPGDPDALEAAILAALERPKAAPERLSYFSFDNFQARLRAALAPVMAAKANS